MSDAMNRTAFENMMDEYLRDELSPSQRKAFDEYIERHPEVEGELDGMRELLVLTAEIAETNPPLDLADQAAAGLHQQLGTPTKSKPSWFRRPAFAWSFAASLLLVVGLTLWPTESAFVYARLIENLKAVDSVKVEGWVRGDNGATISYRQWVVADGTLRAELGEDGHQRVVVLKSNERLIKDYDGTVYHDTSKVKSQEKLESVLTRLQAVYQNEAAAQSNFEYSKDDLGHAVRYTRREYAILGHGPSNQKWVMEVDKKTALPTLLQFYQQLEGRWVQMSDLRFSQYNEPLAENKFQLAGTPVPISEMEQQRFWYELSISPGSIQWPAIHVPDGGIAVYWPTADEMPDGMSGGSSTVSVGGIERQQYWAHSLGNLVYNLTGKKVLANAIANQEVSLLITSKKVLPWKEKLSPVLSHLGLKFDMVPQTITKKRYIFGQNGSNVQPSLHRFSSLSVNADSRGYNYHYENTQLKSVILGLLENCNRLDFNQKNDTIEFVWNGDPNKNPFEFGVDLNCTLAKPTFKSNTKFLMENFGLTLEVEEEKVQTTLIKLKKQ